MNDPVCVQCKKPMTPHQRRASDIGIGAMYHEECWNDESLDESGDPISQCTWCGGEGYMESTDPLWDGDDEVPCSACSGTGLRRHQSLF